MSTEIESTEQNLTAQGSVVASMTGVSRLSGFLRDVVLSAVLGATAWADIFFVALRIPNFFRRLFAEGAFAQAFVPVLSEYRNAGDDNALRNVVRIVCGDFGFVLVVSCAAGIAGASGLVWLFAPGFLDDPGGEGLRLRVDGAVVEPPERLRRDGRHRPNAESLGCIGVIERFENRDLQRPLDEDVNAAA